MSDLASEPLSPQPRGVPTPPEPIPSGVTVPRARPRPDPPVTGAGSTLAGRYRLRTRAGVDPTAGVEFWCARDLVLEREVGVTILRERAAEQGAIGGEDDPTSLERAQGMVVRALRSGAFEHTACARLLDVLTPDAAGLPPDVLGVAVSEWVPGRSLAEAVTASPLRPVAVARALQPLASAVEEAHRHGLVLGVDQPQRIRVRPDGTVQLCFALPRLGTRPADDVRGLGAVLVTLLTARWPLGGGSTAGLPDAVRSPGGALEPPSTLRAGVPVELDALATGTLGPASAAGHVYTAAAVSRLLGEVVDEYDRVALLPPPPDGLPADPTDVWQDGAAPPDPVDPQRRRRLRIALGALVGVVLLIVGYGTFQLTSIFADPPVPAFVVDDALPVGVAAGRTAVADVKILGEDGDNAARVARVIDGDVSTSWRTSVYVEQLPAAKPGVGIVISFVGPVQLSVLTITSPSEGTQMQVRSASVADATFDETTPIATTVLTQRRTTVSLVDSEPVQHVLIWIDQLGGDEDGYVTEINELEFRRALT